MGGFLSTSHAHNHTSSSAGPPPGSNPQPTPIALPDCLGAPYYLCGLGFFILFYFIFFMTYIQVYVCIPPKILVYTLLYK